MASTITVSRAEFSRIQPGKIILRDGGYSDVDMGCRSERRARPECGELVEIGYAGTRSYARHVCRVCAIYTIAISASDDHPLWVDGYPATHAEQEIFAERAGFHSWKTFSEELFVKHGPEFDGYAIEI
jgi:hypothetical protein